MEGRRDACRKGRRREDAGQKLEKEDEKATFWHAKWRGEAPDCCTTFGAAL